MINILIIEGSGAQEYLKLINLLRARSFGDYGFSYFIDQNGEKIYMNIKLSKTNKF